MRTQIRTLVLTRIRLLTAATIHTHTMGRMFTPTSDIGADAATIAEAMDTGAVTAIAAGMDTPMDIVAGTAEIMDTDGDMRRAETTPPDMQGIAADTPAGMVGPVATPVLRADSAAADVDSLAVGITVEADTPAAAGGGNRLLSNGPIF